MAFTFEVKQIETTAGAYLSTSPRAISNVQTVAYDVLVSDDAIDLDPDQIKEHQVLENVPYYAGTTLPVQVNQHVYWHYDDIEIPGGGYVIQPWLFLVGKRIQRDPANRLLFHVFLDFSTINRISVDEADLKTISCPEGVDFWSADLPFLKEIIWGEEDRVVYEDSKTSGKVELRLPTGSLFSEPFKRKYPKKIIRQSQFEDIADEDELNTRIDERLFSINSVTFDGDVVSVGDPANYPPRWMITRIDYQKVQIPEDSDADTVRDGYLMTYTIERNAGRYGWLEARALIDKYYLETANDLSTKREYRSPVDGATIMDCLLNEDGTLLADQMDAEPIFKSWEIQPKLAWTFLRS